MVIASGIPVKEIADYTTRKNCASKRAGERRARLKPEI
jgi:hypothetical protein